MSNLLGPSAVPPKLDEDAASDAPIIDGPIPKVLKVVGFAMLWALGLVLWIMGGFLFKSLSGKGNKGQRPL